MEESSHLSFFPYICMGKNDIRLISRMQWSDYLTGFARLIEGVNIEFGKRNFSQNPNKWKNKKKKQKMTKFYFRYFFFV